MKLMSSNDSIFDSDADILVNPVNCVGVAGKGLALEFRKRFPKHNDHYKERCAREPWTPGKVFLCSDEAGPVIAFMATKLHWRNPSRIEWIEEGLANLNYVISQWTQAKSVAIPALGCGLGGLPWADVLPLIEQFDKLMNPVTVLVYPPKEKALR